MTAPLTFDGEPEEGYFPAYGQIEGPPGQTGARGPTGDKGDSIVGGAPEWEREYELRDVLLSPEVIATLPQMRGEPGLGVLGADAGTYRWAFLPIPTPGPAPVNPGLNPGDPGYDDVMPPYFAALAEWQAAQPLNGIDDVELGVWIEAEPGQAGVISMGLRGPDGGVWLNHLQNLRAVDLPEPNWQMGYDAIDEEDRLLDHRLAWFTDDGADQYAAGSMRRFNRLEQHQDEDSVWLDEFSPAGWAGPQGETTFEVTNQMKDVFAKAEWSGLWSPGQQVANGTGPLDGHGTQWFLAILLEGGDQALAGPVRIKALKLRLQRYRRRFKMVRRPLARFLGLGTGEGGRFMGGVHPDAPRGYFHYTLSDLAGVNPADLPVTVPFYNPAVHATPLAASRWLSWQVPGVLVDPNTHLTGGPGGPSYRWWFALPRPVWGFVTVEASWSRYAPRSGALVNQTADVGKSLVLELCATAALPLAYQPIARDIIRIRDPDDRPTHRIGPVFGLFQAFGLRASNFTTQARDFRGSDDDAYVIQAIGPPGTTKVGSPYVMPLWDHADAPRITFLEAPNMEWFPGHGSVPGSLDMDADYAREAAPDTPEYHGLR